MKNMSRKQIAIVLVVLALIIASLFGGYMLRDRVSGTRLVYNGGGTTDQSKGKASLSDARNTAIVQAVKKVGPAVVGITTRVYNRDMFNEKVQVGQGVGSGVIFDKRGYIVTNNHVVGENKQVVVALADGKNVTGTVIGRDARTDLAVVKVDVADLPVAQFGDSDTLQAGETAIAIGNPLGLELQGTVTVGVISALNRTLDQTGQGLKLIQTDAAINPGNSGGALVNADGEVIGINSAKIAKEGVEGLGFAIPINGAYPILQSIIDNGKVIRPYLGIYGIDKNRAARFGYQLSTEGVYIYKLVAGGPLARAGLRHGDILVKLDDQSITTFDDLEKGLSSHKVGDSIVVSYVRDDDTLSAKVTLAEAPGDDE